MGRGLSPRARRRRKPDACARAPLPDRRARRKHANATMRKRPLGHTGIEVGEIGIGTWGLSGEAYGPIDPGVARATLESAIGSGCTFVDTAGCYGPGGAVETLIGEVLRDRGRD